MLFTVGTFCVGFMGDSLAQSPRATMPPLLQISGMTTQPMVMAPADQEEAKEESDHQSSPDEMELQAPINSTIEIRVARRPWLLEKLIKPRTEPSIKMNPPRPPAELPDPPSMLRLAPSDMPDDGWISRRRVPSYADAPPKVGSGASSDLNESSPDRESSVNNRLRPGSGQAQQSDRDPDPPSEDSNGYSPVESEYSDSNDGRSDDVESSSPESSQTKTSEVDSPDEVDSVDAEPSLADSDSDQAPDEERALEEASTSVEKTVDRSGRAESQDTDSNRDRSTATESELPGRVKVRRLRIGGYGQPIGEEEGSRRQINGISDYIESESISEEAAEVDLDYAGYPREQIRMTRSVQRMQNSIRNCLRYYYSRPEIANERSNWGMLHSIMVYGIDTRVLVGNRSYNAIAWIAGNNACRGQKLLTEQNGMITAKSGVGLQGHQAQMLAIFSLCDVPAKYPLYAGDHRYSLNDIIDAEMLACKSGEELTFTLIGLSHYLDTNLIWRNAQGETWDFERLIREELAQSIVGAACGGTHRLMGFAHALRKRRAEGRPMTGQWKRAEMFSQDFVNYAYRLQNRDGSMSTDWFEGREDSGDLDRKIQTTGHIVEWLLTLTPDSELQNPRLVNAIRFLLNSMWEERDHEWKIGPKGHALRSLAMYYDRVYKSGSAWKPRSVADATRSSRR